MSYFITEESISKQSEEKRENNEEEETLFVLHRVFIPLTESVNKLLKIISKQAHRCTFKTHRWRIDATRRSAWTLEKIAL